MPQWYSIRNQNGHQSLGYTVSKNIITEADAMRHNGGKHSFYQYFTGECVYCLTWSIPGNHPTFRLCHDSLNSVKVIWGKLPMLSWNISKFPGIHMKPKLNSNDIRSSRKRNKTIRVATRKTGILAAHFYRQGKHRNLSWNI